MIVFEDHPEFTPDYSPYELFKQGVFMDHYSSDYNMAGYWRPII